MPTTSYTLTQQALNLVRQLINAKGWAETIEHIYQGGKMLAKDLPQLDPLDWVRSNEQLQQMSKEEQEAYLAQDLAWGQKPCTFELSTKQVEAVKLAFNYFINESGKAKQLGPNVHLFEIIEVFGLVGQTKG